MNDPTQNPTVDTMRTIELMAEHEAAERQNDVAAVTPQQKGKIRFRVGKRYTYDPNRDARLGVKSGRPDPNGPNAEYWPNGALKGTRTIGHKIIRRMFRRAAMRYGSKIGRRILEAQQVHATARNASENPHEARRVLAKELAHARKERGVADVIEQPKTRSELRAALKPMRTGSIRRKWYASQASKAVQS